MDEMIEIFKLVDNLDNLYITCENFNKILNSEKFWIRRFFFRYGKFCKDIYISRKGTWKEYCQDIERKEISYYTVARALEKQRFDIVSIMGEKYNIRVKKISKENEHYYVREKSDIKEGKYTVFEGERKVEYIYKVGKIYEKTIYTDEKVEKFFYEYSPTDDFKIK